MRTPAFKIVLMNHSQVPACETITAESDPWKTLNERIDFSAYIALGQAHVCVAGREVAGFIIFAPEPVFARGGYLRALGVASSCRRNGVGKKLLSFAERETTRYSQYFYLCVSSFNKQGQAFYKSQGYAQAGRLPDLIRPGSVEYLYWKRLRPSSLKTRSNKNRA